MSLLLGVLYIMIIGAVVVSMTVLLLRGKRETYNRMYMGCQSMVVLWCVSQILILMSDTEQELMIAYILGNVGVCFVGACWLGFALSYSGKEISNLVKGIIFGLSSLHYVCALTNDFHFFYYSSFSKEEIIHGPLFFTNVFETYVFVIIGAVILYFSLDKEAKLSDSKDRTNTKELVIAAVIVPVTFNAFYMFGLINATFDITPLGFGISGILVLLATFRYRFMEVNITAFDTILEGISDGVAIFKDNNKCTFENKAFVKYFGKPKASIDIVLSMKKMQKIDENVYKKDDSFLQIQIYQELGNRVDDNYTMDEVTADTIRLDQPCVFVVKNISRYYELLEQTKELGIANEKLALEKERNRIAQQVHDTAGHTLTMIQSYMKLATVSNDKKEQNDVKQYLEDASALTSKGIKELRESINQLRKEAESELVTQGILQLADQVKEIPVEVTVQGEDSDKYSHLSRIFYDSVRESITNTLKYANASKMDIVLRFRNDTVDITIADDGVGCENINDNNGLAGIRQRVEEAGGTVRFISNANEGFLTRISVPVTENKI